MSPLHELSFWTPCLVTGDDALQETVAIIFVVVQHILMYLHSVAFMFL
jgi:hypothetical protein